MIFFISALWYDCNVDFTPVLYINYSVFPWSLESRTNPWPRAVISADSHETQDSQQILNPRVPQLGFRDIISHMLVSRDLED